MIRIEIREESVTIDGYVNAVERESKVLCNGTGKFIEKIRAGAFQRALERAKRASYDVRILLNHKHDRELASTRDKTTKILEDAIGLRCRCEIRDAEVVRKAKEHKLRGWSFGFIALRESWGAKENEVQTREIRELDLREVSILDDSKTPAYGATSIEVRDDDPEGMVELRVLEDEVEVEDRTVQADGDPAPDSHVYENRYLYALIGGK